MEGRHVLIMCAGLAMIALTTYAAGMNNPTFEGLAILGQVWVLLSAMFTSPPKNDGSRDGYIGRKMLMVAAILATLVSVSCGPINANTLPKAQGDVADAITQASHVVTQLLKDEIALHGSGLIDDGTDTAARATCLKFAQDEQLVLDAARNASSVQAAIDVASVLRADIADIVAALTGINSATLSTSTKKLTNLMPRLGGA